MPSNANKAVRWSIAGLLVLAGVVASIRGWETCNDELAAVGSNAVVTVCQSPGITDTVVLGGILLVALLLWPDLSEIGVPGLLSLKRTVVEQQADLAKQQEAIEGFKPTSGRP